MERAGALYSLAREYHDRCEAFDRTVCTGGEDAAGIVHPADHRELGLINANARRVLDDIKPRAAATGFSYEDLMRAIRKAS